MILCEVKVEPKAKCNHQWPDISIARILFYSLKENRLDYEDDVLSEHCT